MAICKQCLRGKHLTLPVAKALKGAVNRTVITGLRETWLTGMAGALTGGGAAPTSPHLPPEASGLLPV